MTISGRCQAVFNAQQTLFDLDHEAPPAWQPPAARSRLAEPQHLLPPVVVALLAAAAALVLSACDNGPSAVAPKQAAGTQMATRDAEERVRFLGYDPATGEVGGAVQSRVFSVGNGVLWAEVGGGVTGCFSCYGVFSLSKRSVIGMAREEAERKGGRAER